MIDWGRVTELRNEIGTEDFDEVVDLFLEEADEVVARLTRNLPMTEVESALHFLKGSALNLGFSELADLCQTGEKVAANGQPNKVDLGKVAEVYVLSRHAFTNSANAKSVA